MPVHFAGRRLRRLQPDLERRAHAGVRQVFGQELLDVIGLEAVSHCNPDFCFFGRRGSLTPCSHEPRLQLLCLGRLVHRAIGLVPHALIKLGERLRRERGRRRGERCVDAHAAIVDLCVEHPRVLLRRRQRLQLWVLMQLALGRDVLSVIDMQFRPQFRRIDPIEFGGVFTAPRLARLEHDADDLFPGGVLSVHQTENLGNTLEAAGIGMGERQRHRADVSIDRHHRPAMLRDQDAFEDCPFERRVVGDPRAVRVSSGRRARPRGSAVPEPRSRPGRCRGRS